ncbi:DUF6190 family protein [Nocardiopsis sp. RSe5-2]|uniref:DUF6190 family protein n=1 Tax=Nocardiopsis endophytica TaxID=3018445 RepID=A0ABT4TYX7_9ACTN|nr:DUF6190 family protein [Nocardiopsis endophytica]MDA2809434.1 DUF6190 family protein [Nocardiopsis endophytica]
MSGEVFVDAALFMGMHHEDERVRRGCKAFFARALGRPTAPVHMSLEQVGLCDALVWRRPRGEQDAYYPFMDRLHTDLRIDRTGYAEKDTRRAWEDPALDGLPDHERLLLGQVMERGGTLHTASARLLARPGLPVEPAEALGDEPRFPGGLEPFYRISLALRVGRDEL